MASEIVLPQWGMEMQDGTIVRWLKQEGDTVVEGEPIVEVETAKLQTELESTASGVLSRIVAQEGEIVPIRGVLCVIAEPGEEVAAAPAAAASTGPAAASKAVSGTNGAATGRVSVQVVPAARRLAPRPGRRSGLGSGQRPQRPYSSCRRRGRAQGARSHSGPCRRRCGASARRARRAQAGPRERH